MYKKVSKKLFYECKIQAWTRRESDLTRYNYKEIRGFAILFNQFRENRTLFRKTRVGLDKINNSYVQILPLMHT